MRNLLLRIASPMVATVFLGLAVGSYALYQGRQYLELERYNLQKKMLQELSYSQVQLAALLHEAKGVLDSNGTAALHSSTSFPLHLSSFLRHGELDQIEVYAAKDCTQLAKVQLSAALPHRCHPRPGLSWLRGPQNRALLGLNIPVEGAEKLWLVGRVDLDIDWLQLHPLLHKSWHDWNLSLVVGEKSDGQALFDLGRVAHDSIWIYAKGWRATLLAGSHFDSQLLLIFSLVFALFGTFCISTVLLRTRLQRAAERDLRLKFFSWLHVMLEAAPTALQESISLEKRLTGHAEYQKACASIKAKIFSWQDALRDLREESDLLKTQLSASAAQLAERERLLSSAELSAAFMLQMRRSVDALASRMARQQQELDTVAKEAMPQLQQASGCIASLVQRWQLAVVEKGSRKFIRTLCESTGLSGQSLLEEELALFSTAAEVISSQTTQIRQAVQHITQEQQKASDVIQVWGELVGSQGSEAMAAKPEEVVNYLQALIALHRNDAQPWRMGTVTVDFSAQPPVPRSIIHSLVSHLLYSAWDQFPGCGGSIDVLSRQRNGREHLIFYVRADAKAEHGTATTRGEYWRGLEALLSGHGLHLHYVPSEAAAFTVSLSWSVQQKQQPNEEAPRLSRVS